jgi:hypothetical protein
MAKLVSEISVKVYGDKRDLSFSTTENIVRWLDAEEPFWKKVDVNTIGEKEKYDYFREVWFNQIRFFDSIRNYSLEYAQILNDNHPNKENQAREIHHKIVSAFEQISMGKIVTSDNDYFPIIAELATSDTYFSAIVLGAAVGVSSSSTPTLPWKTLIQFILRCDRSKKSADWLQPQRKELGQFKADYQTALDEQRAILNEQREQFDKQANDVDEQAKKATEIYEKNKIEWEELKTHFNKDFDKLKKIYDEKLALLAPTQYWSERANSHLRTAKKFAIAFGLVLSAGIAAFVCLAMPDLDVAKNKDAPVLLTLIPTIVPAFGCIWVLKILGRLLSENLQMMREARERETMVKTFLALMRDDQDGKSLIQDNDRILILHSLFRPSSVNTVDDAPPVHLFDILTNKVTGKGNG